MYKTYHGSDFNKFVTDSGEVGFVETVEHPVVHASGLPTAVPKEIVIFESGQLGQILSLAEDFVEILVFSNKFVTVGAQVARTRSLLTVPVGIELLGHVIDPLGHSVYENRPIKPAEEFRRVDIVASGIDAREKVTKPFETGVTLVDLMIPLGKGQRELVIGDRKTGKTEFLLQTMLSQAKKGIICIYACVGKKKTDIKKVEDFFAKHKITDKTLIVASNSLDPLSLIHLTPYSAMTIAEYFRDTGNDVLLVFDDLTTHAKFYREISLLGNRFPGRSSYPGDIFYTHSRLLERGGNFITEKGVFSITCLPVAETIEGDISGYIQTNLMSITDGHVYFDSDLFSQGRRPAINYFLSVTRVGRQTQSKLRWTVNRELTTLLSLLEKTQTFVHFGAELSEGVKATLVTGKKILDFFSQPMSVVIPINLQIVLFGLIWLGLLKGIEDEVNMKYVVGEAAQTYENDENFRALVDELVSSSDDFNVMLNKLSTRSQDLISYLKLNA